MSTNRCPECNEFIDALEGCDCRPANLANALNDFVDPDDRTANGSLATEPGLVEVWRMVRVWLQESGPRRSTEIARGIQRPVGLVWEALSAHEGIETELVVRDGEQRWRLRTAAGAKEAA